VQTREEYRIRAAAKLEELRLKVWMVKQKADEMRDEAQAEHYELFQMLHEKSEEAEKHLVELEKANEERERVLQARLDGALSDLNNSVGNILSRMGWPTSLRLVVGGRRRAE
jgi:hypothetical protein